VKVRSTLLMLPVVAALSLGTLAPAQAMPAPDAVTGLTVNPVVQAPGATLSFKVTASWDQFDGATGYRVEVLDENCDATNQYALGDVSAANYSATLANLGGSMTYCLSVIPKGVVGATAATATFDTPAADTVAPNGRYVVNPASAFLLPDFSVEGPGYDRAVFRITQVAADSDVASRRVLAGDGTAARVWKSGRTFTLEYRKAGTFTPHVLIADQFGNTNDIKLTPVRVINDHTPPRVQIARPTKPAKAASWRVIRGTATDESGVQMLMVFTMEKRHGIWWVYDFSKARWNKGVRSFNKTMMKSKARPKMFFGKKTANWTTPKIKGLTKGTLRVYGIAVDRADNYGVTRVVQKVR